MTNQRSEKGRFLPGHQVNSKVPRQRKVKVNVTLPPWAIEYVEMQAGDSFSAKLLGVIKSHRNTTA